MFKQAVLVVLQVVLFLILFVTFSVVLPGLGTIPAWRIHVSTVHDFVLNGVIFMLVAYVILLGIEAARRRLRPAGSLTTLALVLAFCLGLAMKFGLVAPLSAR